MVRLFSGLFLLGCLSVGSSWAAVIHDNGAPDHANGFEITHWVEADDFTLTADTLLDGVKFWDFEIAGNFTGNVSWEIFSNTIDNQPGTLLASGTSINLTHTSTGFVIFGPFNEFVNVFDISPVILPAGIYWMALHNGPRSNNLTQNVFWESTSQTGPRASEGMIAPFDAPWFSNFLAGTHSELAFQLTGTPLPEIRTFGLSNHVPSVSFTTVVGENYRVEYRNSLVGPAEWTPIPGAEMMAGTGGMIAIVDPDPNVANLPRRFYRVVLL